MMYLIGKIVLFLVAAFVLGFVVAWLASRAAAARREREITARWERKLGDLQRERDTSMAKLRREVEDYRQQIPTLEASLGDRSDLIARLESDLVEWRAKLPDLEERLREREEKIGEFEAALKDKDLELKALREEFASAGELHARERDADAGRVQAARKETDESRASAEAARQEADELRATAEAARKETEEIRASAEAARKEAGEMHASAEAGDNRVQEFEVEIERLRTVTDRAKGERDEAQRLVRDLRRQIEEQEAARVELTANLETARRGSTGELFETVPPGLAPDGLLREVPAGRAADDLKQIRGVGPVLERTLNRLGIYFFAQIAGLGEREVEWVAHHLNTFPGRIARDRWVEQAAQLDAARGQGG